MNSEDKRNSVRNDYDLIAQQYSDDYGSYIEDLDIYEEFENHLSEGARIVDLGCGSGRTYAYFHKKGYEYVGLDFSEKMKERAFDIHGEFPYIVDDIVNMKSHFDDESVDAVFAVYSLFHLPKEDFEKAIADVNKILRKGGVFLFSYQLGSGEVFTDEPYLGKEGQKVLYMNYMERPYVDELLSRNGFEKVYESSKHESGDGVIGEDGNDAVYVIAKKLQ